MFPKWNIGSVCKKASSFAGSRVGKRPSLDAYNRSPGDSKENAGTLFVKAIRDAKAPPREWPLF